MVYWSTSSYLAEIAVTYRSGYQRPRAAEGFGIPGTKSVNLDPSFPQYHFNCSAGWSTSLT